MNRRLLKYPINVARAFALLLAAASLAMWARSHCRADAWVAEPRLANSPEGAKVTPRGVWEMHRALGSTSGRLVWLESREAVWLDRFGFGRQLQPVGWVHDAVAARLLDRPQSFTPPLPAGTVDVVVLGVAEYAVAPPHTTTYFGALGGCRYVSVSWLVFAIPGAIVLTRSSLRSIRRAKARRLNLCPVCGYDLRASGDRCPECGSVVNDPAAIAKR